MLFNSYLYRVHNRSPNAQANAGNLQSLISGGQALLSIDEKYEIASTEAEVLKESVKEGKKKSDALLETLKAVLDEADMAIIEIRKDAFDFQREILIGGENSRTGKIEAERIIKYRREKNKQKDALIEKLKAKKSTLNHQIDKIKAQLLKKQELGDDLKFIDFHQLQIENKKYVKEIDEKNSKLLHLKIATGKIVKMWNERKIKLNEEIRRKEELVRARKDTNRMIKETNKEIELFRKEFMTFETKVEDLKSKVTGKNNETDKMNVESFIDEKKREKLLNKELKNFVRKIDIAKLRYMKAIKGLRRMGDDLQADDVSLSDNQEYM